MGLFSCDFTDFPFLSVFLFCKTYKKTVFTEHLWTTASEFIKAIPASKTFFPLVYNQDQVLFQTVLLLDINLRLASCHPVEYALEFQSMLPHQLVILAPCTRTFPESNKPMERTCLYR